MKPLFDKIKEDLEANTDVLNVRYWNNNINQDTDQYNHYRYPMVYVDFSQQVNWDHLPFRVRHSDEFPFVLHLKQEAYKDIEEKDTYELVRNVINSVMNINVNYDGTNFYDISRINFDFESKNIDDTNIITYQLFFSCNVTDYSLMPQTQDPGLSFTYSIGLTQS